MFRLSGLYFAFLPRSAAFVESFPPLFRGGRRGPEICRRAESAEAGRRGEREAAGESPGNASMFRTGAAGRRRRRRKSGGMAGGVAEKGGTGRKPAEVRHKKRGENRESGREKQEGGTVFRRADGIREGDVGGRKRRVGGRKAGDWPVRREAAGGCGPGLGRGRNGRVSGRIRLLFYRRVRCVSGGGRLQSPYSGRYRPDLPQGRGP